MCSKERSHPGYRKKLCSSEMMLESHPPSAMLKPHGIEDQDTRGTAVPLLRRAGDGPALLVPPSFPQLTLGEPEHRSRGQSHHGPRVCPAPNPSPSLGITARTGDGSQGRWWLGPFMCLKKYFSPWRRRLRTLDPFSCPAGRERAASKKKR